MRLALNLTDDRVDDDGRCVTIALAGEVDIETATPVRVAVARSLAAGARTVVLDLAAVTFVDSSGLGALLDGHRLATGAGRRLVLAGPTAQTRRLLAVTGLDQVLAVRA